MMENFINSMNMYRYKHCLVALACLVAALLPYVNLGAKDLTSGQKELRTELFNFLRGSGYSPSIDEDGDIEFEANGVYHWVVVSENDTDPYYVTVMRAAPYVEDYDYDRVLHACDELNLYKTVKVEPLDEYAVIKSALYLYRASALTDVFFKVLEVMDDAYDDFEYEYYNAPLCRQ